MDQKKNKQVNISLDDSDYALIKTIAFLERRNISDIARLILIDNARLLYNQKYSDIKPAYFIPSKEKEDQ